LDKAQVSGVLASYSPPLSASQIEAIAEELCRLLNQEIGDAKKEAAKPKRKS
jgi:hypothetical protein